jgi:hypothetical protein
MNGIVVLRSGLPFSVTQTNTINTIEGHVRPDLVGNPKLSNPTIDKWYDPDAFRVVTCQQPGSAATDAGRGTQSVPGRVLQIWQRRAMGIIEGPGFKNVDYSLIKNITS